MHHFFRDDYYFFRMGPVTVSSPSVLAPPIHLWDPSAAVVAGSLPCHPSSIK